MPTIAHNMDTARALYHSSMAGALIEVNRHGQIQTASFGTRMRDAVIHLFLGQDARMDFRAAKAQQVAAKFLEMTQASRANPSSSNTINGRNIRVSGDDPAYENLSIRFMQAATFEHPIPSGSQGFDHATYASTEESPYEVPVHAMRSAFENSTYAGVDASDYEVPVTLQDDTGYAEIPAAVSHMIREYGSSDDLVNEVIAQARPMVAFKAGDHIVPVGIGHNGQVYRHHVDHTAPTSAREAVEWVSKQLNKKTCDVQGLTDFDSVAVDRLLSKLGITAQFKTPEGNNLERRSVLESIPQHLKDRFAAEISDVMADTAQIRQSVVAADSSVLYERLNSYQSSSVIHRELATTPSLTGDAKALALVFFDDLLSKTIAGLSRLSGLMHVSQEKLTELASAAIAKASQEFPAHA